LPLTSFLDLLVWISLDLGLQGAANFKAWTPCKPARLPSFTFVTIKNHTICDAIRYENNMALACTMVRDLPHDLILDFEAWVYIKVHNVL
jgi:hypothetical protein